MSSQTVMSGGCLCGAVRYRVSEPASNLCFCHCASCRRATGAMMVAWGTFAAASFDVTRARLGEFSSSPDVWRAHCADCGTAISYRHEGRPGEIDITLATLDDPAALAPEAHIWVRDKLPWIRIADGLPQFEAFRSSPDVSG